MTALGTAAPTALPAGHRLQHYPDTVDAGDLYRHAPAAVAGKWAAMAEGLFAMAEDGGSPVHEQIARQIQDLGMSFRIAGDEDERPWPLSPMPLIIGAREWSAVEQGLIQRARLMEALATDIYGQQQLVRDGHLPAAVIAGSRYFARKMIGLHPRGDHYLHVYAVDLARGPQGQWRVLTDRLRMASGIGYALENRLALSRSTGTMLSGINARRLAGFFAALREGIARDCQRENPRIALLTPGRFNQSYPEQAHLARYLGLPLVEGRDLTVSDSRLYVRTIAGLKRIDAVWRWIDTNAIDPLSFDAQSAIGVPDLFDAWAQGGLELVNWPGVELLEAPAFAAFIPRLFRKLLGEEPLLPNTATWWCGHDTEAATVRSRIDDLVITPAFGTPVAGLAEASPIAGSSLCPQERETLFAAMQQRPMDYCGQEIVRLSTTPAMIEGAIVPRPFMLRAFVARGADGEWTVMPGGFARLSSTGELFTPLIDQGDLSADVCIVDDRPGEDAGPSLLPAAPAVQRGGGILASQAADNLFWFGRYMERTDMTLRIVRAVLGGSIEVDTLTGQNPDAHRRLIDLLHLWAAIPANGMQATEACRAALARPDLPGSVAALLGRLRGIGMALRDRFSSEFWRIASAPIPPLPPRHQDALLQQAHQLVLRFSTLSGLIAENMNRGAAWRFLDLGRRIERGLATCRIARHMTLHPATPAALGVLLDLCDSQITYRSRYLTGPAHVPVLDLVLLDTDNPRSLVFQLAAVEAHLAALSANDAITLPEAPLLAARGVLAPLVSLPAEAFDDATLARIEGGIPTLSEAIAARYFLHFEKPEYAAPESLLA